MWGQIGHHHESWFCRDFLCPKLCPKRLQCNSTQENRMFESTLFRWILRTLGLGQYVNSCVRVRNLRNQRLNKKSLLIWHKEKPCFFPGNPEPRGGFARKHSLTFTDICWRGTPKFRPQELFVFPVFSTQQGFIL